MAEVFAGFVCGYGLAVAVTPLAAIALVRARVTSLTMQRLVPQGTSLIAVSIILHGFALLALTAIGILAGLILAGMEDRRPAGGLGSPNALFTALVLASSAIAVLPMAMAVPRWRAPLLGGGFVFSGTFGWLMPYLSLLGPGQS